MPTLLISLTTKQLRALGQNVHRAGKGSISSEIRKAIDQYLAGLKKVEAALLRLLDQKAPSDLQAMLSRSKKANARIDRTIAWLDARLRQMPKEGPALSGLSPLAQQAVSVFGSPQKAIEWFSRQNRTLGQRTPEGLLTSPPALNVDNECLAGSNTV